MFQGGVQALSRSCFTKLIPAEKTGEFFGIYDIFGKSAAILGLGLTSLLGLYFPLNQYIGFNISLIPLPALFAIGLVIFLVAMKIPATVEKKDETSSEE
jgi:UMF1 family MFS transporter